MKKADCVADDEKNAHRSSSGGGGYVIFWGAILFGGIQFFRGVGQVSATPESTDPLLLPLGRDGPVSRHDD